MGRARARGLDVAPRRPDPGSMTVAVSRACWVPLSVALALTGLAGCSLPTSVIGGADGNVDASLQDAQTAVDVGVDSSVDADVVMPDTGMDAGGTDAGNDAGNDAAPTPDTGTDAGPDAWTPECTGSATQCHAGNTAVDTCTGGVWVTGPACALGCLAGGGAHCATFDVVNVGGSTVPGTSTVSVSTAITITTDGCTGLPGVTGRVVTQDAGGSMVCLFDVGSLTVTSTGNIRVTGAYPLVIVSQGDVVVDGVIDASSYSMPLSGSSVIGPGAGTGGNAGANGTAGSSNNTDGGGGGGGFGGNGGNGAAEGSGSGGGMGGAMAASTLIPLLGGANGGGGSNGGMGGSSGGAIQITAFGTLSVDGTIAAAGGGGRGGGEYGGGGGGGSGGAILLQAPTITLGSSTTAPAVTVAGGGGASGGCGTGMPGLFGQDGFYAALGQAAGGVACGGSDGGVGGGAATAGGTNAAGGSSSNGSGGGGSVGRVVFMSRSGAVPAGSTNPSTGGALAHPTLMLH